MSDKGQENPLHTLAQSAIETCSTGIIILNKDERIVLWNHWMVQHARIDPDEAIGCRIEEIFPGHAIVRVCDAIKSALIQGLSSILSPSLHQMPFHLYTAVSGHEHTESTQNLQQTITISPIKADQTICHCLIQITDMSDAIKRENLLRVQARQMQSLLHKHHANELYLRAILNNTLDGIITVNEQGKIEVFNPAAENIFNFHSHEVIDQPIHLLIPQLYTTYDEALRQSLRLPNTYQEIWGKRKDGTLVSLELSINKVKIMDNQVMICLIRDVTKRKHTEAELRQAKEAAEAANRAKSDFLATMSHEIRTPMSGVIGMIELLNQTALDPQQAHYVEMVRSSGEALLNLINDILDFSKIEAGKLNLEIIQFDLCALLEEVVNLFAASAHSKKLVLACQLPPIESIMLRGDPSRLRQVLSNLLGNAIKFTEQGEVILKTTVLEAFQQHYVLRFEVTDTGIGISSDDIKRLFKPFSQADSSTTRRYGGSGLGLAISRRLVQLMGGEINLTSQQGKGSTFWFNMPLPKSDTAIPTKYTPTQMDKLKKVKVLFFVQGHHSIKILVEQTQAWGMRPTVATTAAQCLQLLKENHYDMVILDDDMPDVEKITRLIQATPQTTRSTLILLTSMDKPLNQNSISWRYLISKPILNSKLLTVLLDILTGQSPQFVALGAQYSPQHHLSLPNQLFEKRILVAEDNPVNQEVIRAMLTQLGCYVAVVGDGEQVLQVLTDQAVTESYDLIFMDCHMPNVDGFDTTTRIRQLEQTMHRPRMPIIALTASVMPVNRERCVIAGMDDYLAKPVRLEELCMMLIRHLGNGQTQTTALDQKKPIQIQEKPIKETKSNDSVLAIDDLSRMRQDMRSRGINWLIDIFLNELPAYLEDIRQAVASGDGEALYLKAHKFKGGCKNMAATQMITLCQRLETLGRAQDIAAASTLVHDELEDAAKALKEALEQEKRKEKI